MSQRASYQGYVLALSTLTAACSGNGTVDAAARPSPALELAQTTTATATTDTAATGNDTPQAAAAAAPTAPERSYYDLAQHLSHAEIYEGDTLVMDYGTPGSAKYTLGGWLSRGISSRTLEDTSVSVVANKTVKVTLPAQRADQRHLSIRLRSFKPGPLTVYVNDATIANVALNGTGLQTLDFTLAEDLLRIGENTLQLRVTRSGSAPGIADAGLAIDWVRLGTARTEDAASSPPPHAPETIAVDNTLRLPVGLALGYACPIPAGGRLRATVKSDANEQPGRLELVALRDGEPALPLGEVTGSASGAALDVDLSRLVGSVARIELRAAGGAVTLEQPRIVTLVEAATRTPGASGASAAATPQVKNVIVVLIDTLRADKLKPYNQGTRVTTPALDGLVRSSSVMTNARTQENWTKPSVATLLSSLLPWEHGAVTGDAVVPNSVELMPEVLREHGFYTGAFITNGYVSDKFGFKQGWHTYRNYIREGRPNRAQYVAADVLDWLDRRPQDKPFFLYVHTIDPHVPYKPPQHFLEMYDTQPYSGVVDFSRDSTLLENIKIGRTKLNGRDKERLMALYDAEISYHDAHFASILEGLERRGLANNTMIVVTSDHGEEFWDHGSVGHGHSVYDELLHVPLVVKVPGVTDSGPAVAEAVGLVDVLPTVLDVLQLPASEQLAGRSFLPQLRGQGATAPRTAVSGFMDGWRTLGVGTWKLIQRTAANTTLYNVANDPGEQTDLSAARPLTVRYLRGQLGLTLDGQTASASNASSAASGSATPTAAAKPRPAHRTERTEIDPETEAQLRALGYVGTSAP